jgi:hypothetical protein
MIGRRLVVLNLETMLGRRSVILLKFRNYARQAFCDLTEI